MILSGVVIVSAATVGTLGASIRVYRERKREKEFPWTVAAERFARNERGTGLPFAAKSGVMNHVLSNMRKVHAKSQTFTLLIVAPFVSDTRNQQLADITDADITDADITDADTSGELQSQRNAKKNLYVSSANLLCISAGALFYAPLYVPGILGIVYIYSFFLKGTYHAIVKERRANLDVLMTAIGAGALVGGFFFVLALGNWYACLIRWLLSKTSNDSRKSLVNLFGEVPRSVWVMVDGEQVVVPFEQLQIGDQVVVVAGQVIPVDGTISTGVASIDQQMLTGEGQTAERSIGEPVFASTVVLSGQITVRVEQTGSETVAAQIGQILNTTADFNLSINSRVESFLSKVVPSLFVLSAATFPWLGLNGALAVLWGCPGYRALILGPMGMLNYLHILSRQGILIKNGHSLERLNDIDTIVFDKTGTLTEEMPVVSQIFSCSYPSGLSSDQLLTLAAAAEYRQTHPIARAILQAADMRQLEVPQIDHTHVEVGYGLKVNLNESVIRVGSERFMQMCGITIPHQIKKEQARCNREGYSLVYVAIDEQLGGAIELVPTIRPEVKEVIRTLRERGLNLHIISGDHEAPTRRLAQELGISYSANTLPEKKADKVAQLQEAPKGHDKGRSVCFIGDGINDAIALKQANVSISLRGATTIAMDTADIVLMDGSLSQLVDLFELAQEFNQNLNRNFMITIIPETIGIAGTLLFGWGLSTAVIFKGLLWFPQLSHVMLPLYKHKDKI